MISGAVTGNAAEARVDVAVRGPAGAERSISAVIDTGFTDQLTLPSSLVAELSLLPVARQHAILADGTVVVVNVHQAEVIWDGGIREVSVLATQGTPLVGMALLHGYHLGVDVVAGGSVQISALNIT